MSKIPKNNATYYVYALNELNDDKLPKKDLKTIVMDNSHTFCGIALYREKLSGEQIKENSLVYLGVYCGE